ncbi:hypothetical protein [Haloferula sp. BvORR071]|uniref:hypothetical protein n=1 Tax=Haloferula sp. BvORR071 TaxID=1396141 RepID=UPI002240FDB3|nr:hypothetical protein [Haloferula sp. BvORR071]
MTLGWLSPILTAALIFTFPVAFGQDEEIDKQLATAAELLATELAAKAELELPPLPPELAKEKPPEIIRQAGDEYVKAWRTYRAVTLHRPQPQKPPAEARPERPVNATKEDWAKFQDLLARTFGNLVPPDPAEYDEFVYQSDGWCATPAIAFWATQHFGKALATLRKGEYFPALQMLAERRWSPALESLLRAHGVDPDEFIVGAWLHRKLTQHDFPPSSGDKAATMLLKWVELRWQAAGETSATTCWKNEDEPFYPLEGFMVFLGDDSSASDDTKRKIASFLENQGCKLQPPEY